MTPRHFDQGRPVRLSLGGEDRGLKSVLVVAVDPLHGPAVRLEAPLDVVAHGDGRVALDGDAVVVVDVDKVAEAEARGNGRRLRRDALEEVAVRDNAEDVARDGQSMKTMSVTPIGVTGSLSLAASTASTTGKRIVLD